MVGSNDESSRVAVLRHRLQSGPEAFKESVGGGDHVEHTVVTFGVSPVVGLIERDSEDAGLGGFEIFEGHFKSEGVVASLVPGAESDVLEPAETGGRSRVLIACVNENRARGVFGDVVKMVPTGKEGDTAGEDGEFALEKFENGFVRLLDGV